MGAPNDLKSMLIRDEGLRLKPYTDSTGHLTVGFGRNLSQVGISLAEAEYLLDHDIARASADVQAALPWVGGLDEARRDVLINLSFNMGIHGLLQFRKMLTAIQAGKWDVAAIELLNSDYHAQVGSRADRLAKQIETGDYV